MPKDPFVDFISTLADKIRVEKEHRAMMQKINSSEAPIAENKASLENVLSTIQEKIEQEITKTDPIATESITEQDADNFGDFVSRLKSILGGEKRMPTKLTEPVPAIVENDAAEKSVEPTQEIITPAELAVETKPVVIPIKETKKIKAKKQADAKKEYLEVLEQLSGSVAAEPGSTKITDIKKLFEEYAEKYIKKAMVMAEYAGGGGTNAVQYANGGVMNGDLNVTGNYLSAGVNLLNVFSGGGGGGPADRLVNGSYQAVLSSNGDLIFPTGSKISKGYPGEIQDGSSWFVSPTGGYPGGLASADGEQYVQVGDNSNIYIGTGWPDSLHEWIFRTDGKLTVPGAIGTTTGNSKLDLVGLGPNTAYLTTTPDDTTALFMGVDPVELRANNYVSIATNTGDVSRLWTFGADGGLIFPDNTTQTTAYTGIPANIAYTNQDTIFEKNVTIQGNLTALGTSTFKNTLFTTTSALSVYNTGPGPALYIFQAAGPYDVASFYDGDGVEVLHVGNAQGGGNPLGKVGINESFPGAELTVNGAISSNRTITALGGNSNQWNSNWTTTNGNSAAWSNWQSVSANYALGSQYVKLSGDTMTGLLTNNTGISSFSLSARFIDLVHLPANDGTNPVLRIGEFTPGDTTLSGFSGMYMSYDETTNAFGISAQFAPAAGIPAINIDRNAVVGARTIVAGPAFDSFSTTTPISAVSGMYVDAVSGYAGFYTNNPIAPVDVRGGIKKIGSISVQPYAKTLRIQDNYLYLYNSNSSTINQYVLSGSDTTIAFVASAATGTGSSINTNVLAVRGRYVYVSESSGIRVYNTTSNSLVSAGYIAIPDNGSSIQIQGNYLFALAYGTSYPGSGRLTVYDISNPIVPVRVFYVADSSIQPQSIIIQGQYLYYIFNAFGTAVLYKWDITDPRKPINGGSASYSGSINGIAVKNSFAYVSESSALRVYSVVGAPALVATITGLPSIAGYSEPIIDGDYLYIPCQIGTGPFTQVICVINISNPYAPKVVRYLTSTGGGTYNLVPSPQIKGRYMYLSDGVSSINIFDLGGSYIQNLRTGTVEAASVLVDYNATIAGNLGVLNDAYFARGYSSLGDSSINGTFTVTSGASTFFTINTAGNVGINTSNPGTALTVVGTISTNAHKTSQDWASNWSTTNSNSANWSSVYTSFNSNSSVYDSNWTTVNTNSGKWDSNWTTTNTNSAAWSNWQSVSGNYALGSQYVKLSGDNMTGLLTNNTGISSFSLSARFIDLVHIPANDGANPVLRIGEYDTTGGNAGFSGMYMSYSESTNTFGISADFDPAAGIPAVSIDRNAVVGVRTLVAGPAFDSFSTTTPISAVSGVYVEPVSGYAGFYTNAPVAPVDIRGSTKVIGFSAFGNNPSCLRMRDDYLYVLCYTNSTLNVFDTSTSVPQFVASAATLPLGTMSTMAIQGKYAYVTTTSGMQSFDISAITPVSAGSVGTQSYFSSLYSQPFQIMIQGRYAYFTHYSPNYPNSNNFCVVDISDPTRLSHLLSPPTSLFGGNANFTIQGNNMYYGYSFVGGNYVYQANLAATPVPVPFSNFTAIQSGTVGIPLSIAAQGRYVYIAGNSAFYVIDTTKTGTSRVVATLTLDNMFTTAYLDMVIQRQYAYVLRSSGIYIINISNPLNPVIVQRLSISISTSSYRGMVVKGRYLYFTDGTNSYIYRVDLGGSYVQQLEAGGIHTEHMYSSNVYAANEIVALGSGSFANGLNVQGFANVQGSLNISNRGNIQSPGSSTYFTVFSSFAVTTDNKVTVGASIPSPGSTLTVAGSISASGNLATNTNYVVTAALTANLTMPSAADTLLPLSAKNDPNGWFSNTTSRFTPTVPGYYHADYQVSWQGGTAGSGNQNNIQILKSGTTVSVAQQPINGSNVNTTQNTATVVYLNGSTDYLTFQAYSSNAAQVITGEANGTWTKVDIFKIN